MCTRTFTYSNAHTSAYTHTLRTCTHKHTHIEAHMHVRKYVCARTDMHACMLAHTHAHMHEDTH